MNFVLIIFYLFYVFVSSFQQTFPFLKQTAAPVPIFNASKAPLPVVNNQGLVDTVKEIAGNVTNALTNGTDAPGFIDVGLNNVSIDSLGWFALKESDVQFRLVTRRTCLNYQRLHIGRMHNNSFLDPKQPVKIITHGYMSGIDTIWVYNMTAEYVKKADLNVIQVDWSDSASGAYPVAARYTQSVGLYVAKLIADLHKNLSVPLSNIHLIGHSLGAHVMGFAGAYVQQYNKANVSRITGMDPAGPLFLLASPANRLDRSDASFVDIIHTDGNRYGYYATMGTVDFYPNGGIAPQPACRSGLKLASDLVGVGCSHGLSHEYFTESIRSTGFVGRQCDNFVDYQLSRCESTSKFTTAIMGENVSHNSTGTYYLEVNADPPYAKN